VNKRECGTCRFFEQSGIGETGWCRNARCKDIVGIALVRRQELACRIGWNDDFYEPLAATADAIPGESRNGADAARQRSGYQGTRPDDIIVGIERPRTVTEREPMPTQRSRMSNVGEAHRRALERRQIAQQSGDEYAPRTLDPPPTLPTQDAAASAPAAGEPFRRPALTGDEGVSMPRRVDPGTAPGAPDSPYASTVEFPIPQAAPERPAYEQATNAPWAAQQSPTPYAATPSTAQPPGYVPPRPEYPAPAPAAGAGRSSLDLEWEAQERQRQRGKRCANCRHFQIAESGDRGWCRNRFAFPTPQLVGPNDLACLTGIGTWWAANDQGWLAKAGLPAQAGPTPLADALHEEMQEEEKRRAAFRRPSTG
jgi:hypothetical protein